MAVDWEDRTKMFTIGEVDGGKSWMPSGSKRQEYTTHKGAVIRANKHRGDTWTKEDQRELTLLKDKAILELVTATKEREAKDLNGKGGKKGQKYGRPF